MSANADLHRSKNITPSNENGMVAICFQNDPQTSKPRTINTHTRLIV